MATKSIEKLVDNLQDRVLNIDDIKEMEPDIFLDKTRKLFSEYEQQTYLVYFLHYIYHRDSTKFVVNLDDMQRWIGCANKNRCIKLLECCSSLNQDYIIIRNSPTALVTSPNNCVIQPDEETPMSGGVSDEPTYMMTIATFEMCCLKAKNPTATNVYHCYEKFESLRYQHTRDVYAATKQRLHEQDLKIHELNLNIHASTLEKHAIALEMFADTSLKQHAKTRELHAKTIELHAKTIAFNKLNSQSSYTITFKPY